MSSFASERLALFLSTLDDLFQHETSNLSQHFRSTLRILLFFFFIMKKI